MSWKSNRKQKLFCLQGRNEQNSKAGQIVACWAAEAMKNLIGQGALAFAGRWEQ